MEIFVTFPNVVIILFDNFSINEPQLHIYSNSSFQQIPVCVFTVSILCNLLNETIFQFIFNIFEALIPEIYEGAHREALHIRILQVISILNDWLRDWLDTR